MKVKFIGDSGMGLRFYLVDPGLRPKESDRLTTTVCLNELY